MLQLNHISKTYFNRKKRIIALDQINLTIYQREILAIVGESGSGKSTLAHLIMRLEKPDDGNISFNSMNIFHPLKGFDYHRKVQMIFQHPDRSLNPRMTVEELILEPLVINNDLQIKNKKETLKKLWDMVLLPMSLANRLPSELSGGQKQRVAIARALALRPQLLVADEATSSLDALTELEMLELLKSLRNDTGISILFITHNLEIIRSMADRVGVMHAGRLIEISETNKLFTRPLEMYTRQLLKPFINTQSRQSEIMF